MSVERALEEAYKAVAIANESPFLTDIPFLLSTDTANGTDPDKLPLPSITLTAQRQQEQPPNSGVYPVELFIEVRDAAVREDGPAIRLDELYTHAIRPLLYKPIPGMITAAGQALSLKCFGMPERTESGQIVFGEGMLTRSATALFICSCTV